MEVKKDRERDTMRELKRRKMMAPTTSCGLTIHDAYRARGPRGIFVRREPGDEYLDVEMSPTASYLPLMDVDTPTSKTSFSIPSPSLATPPPVPIPMALAKTARTRRPSTKLQNQGLDQAPRRTRRRSSALARREPDPDPEPPPAAPSLPPPSPSPPAASVAKSTSKSGKPPKVKPDTYKQLWSDSEQHLLERLLEEIPEGEKNRCAFCIHTSGHLLNALSNSSWQKISQAMNGKRTPRQVASRVQKYFEKLKRFGVGADGG